MKFTVAQKDLIYSINILQKAVPIRTSMDVLKGIYIETIDNHLVMKTNDLSVSIIINLPAHISENGKTLVDASLFTDIIRKLPDEGVSINIEDNKMIIKSGQSLYNLPTMESDSFPQVPIVKHKNRIVINQGEFSNMIKMTNFAVSKDDKSPILTGQLLDIKDKMLKMVSIDGFSIAIKNSSIISGEDDNIVIPGKILSELQKIIAYNVDEDIELLISDNYVIFKFDTVEIIAKLLEGNYINYNQLIEMEFGINVRVNRRDLYDSIDRVALMANRSKDYLVIFEFLSDKLIISANTSIGNAKETINIDKKGKDLKIGFNPNYLLKALKVIEDEYIDINMSSNINPCSITPIEEDEYKYLFVPVRIKN